MSLPTAQNRLNIRLEFQTQEWLKTLTAASNVEQYGTLALLSEREELLVCGQTTQLHATREDATSARLAAQPR